MKKALASTVVDMMTADPVTVAPDAPVERGRAAHRRAQAQPAARGRRGRPPRRRRHAPRRARRAAPPEMAPHGAAGCAPGDPRPGRDQPRGHRAQLRPAARRPGPRGAPVRGRQGRRLRPRRRRRRRARRWRAARLAGVAAAARGRASCARPGIDGPAPRDGRADAPRSSPIALRRRRRRRRPGATALRRRAAPAGGAAVGVHVKLDTGMGRLGHARPRRGARASPRPSTRRRAWSSPGR